MSAVIRCKMRVQEVTHSLNEKGETETEKVKLTAVVSNNGDNAQWAKWTPSAGFEISITNPSAMKKLLRGKEFFIDFTPAEEGA